MPYPPVVGDFDRQQNLQAIDALRGYAILLVICMHVLDHVPGLVWPAKRLLLLGHTGVQLFFIASAVTLLMSWSRESGHSLGTRIRMFFTNRFFRIAPLYFLAIVFYWLFAGRTGADFRLDRLLATLFFVNDWSPDLLPTTGGWSPVPGGWSISAEFMFYMVFPLLALSVTTMARAVGFLVASYLVMVLAAMVGPSMYQHLGAASRQHFLFFWPPNQLVVFAIGFLLYRCIKSTAVRAWVARSPIDATRASLLLAGALLSVQFYDMGAWPRLAIFVPQHLLLTLLYASWALFMVLKPTRLAASRLIVKVGRMSFSIYLIHFATLSVAASLLASAWPFATTGVAAILHAALLLVLGACMAYLAARVTYRFVERPFIKFGKSLHTAAVAPAVAEIAAAAPELPQMSTTSI